MNSLSIDDEVGYHGRSGVITNFISGGSGVIVYFSDVDEEEEIDIDELKEQMDLTDVTDTVDWLEHIEPIIEDVLDGEERSLNQNDIDFISIILRAKLEHKAGIISDDDLTTILNTQYE